MLWSLFSSKNKKLVKKWIKEHEQIVVLAHKVIAEYSTHNHDAAKKELKALNKLAVEHLMTEDIEFYRLLKDEERVTPEIEKLVKEFTNSFKDTKSVLMKFLIKYSKDEAILDDEFFNTFNEIVSVLADRIAFEEKNLYAMLQKS